jgi:hypothetical protein
MADSDFWRSLAAKFRGMIKYDPSHTLHAGWKYTVIVGQPSPKNAEWHLAGSERPLLSQTIRLEFEALARRGGAKIDPGIDSFLAWLETLRSEGLNSASMQPVAQIGEAGTPTAFHYSGTIVRLSAASADLCRILESRALEAERIEAHRPAASFLELVSALDID